MEIIQLPSIVLLTILRGGDDKQSIVVAIYPGKHVLVAIQFSVELL